MYICLNAYFIEFVLMFEIIYYDTLRKYSTSFDLDANYPILVAGFFFIETPL